MLRILLIDDNPNDRLIATRELRQAFPQIEVQSIADAEALGRAILTGGFDLVVTDYRLLWSDGLKVLQAVKTRYPNCPVVMFTDSGSEEIAVEGMKAGLSDYVLKGRQAYRLSIAVRESLEKQKLRHDYASAIEQLQASEETLRLALEAGNSIAYSWDITTGVVHRLSDWKNSEGQALNEPAIRTFEDVLSLIYPEDREQFQAAINAALEGKSPYEAEFRAGQPGGPIRWIYDRGQIIFDQSGQPLRLIGVATDITGRKQIEEEQARLLELEQAARTAAESANQVKDEFLATLSHELRSPLNAILGWSQLLRSRKLDPATMANALETIERNAKLQTQLIEDLLDVSRIIRGKLRLHVAPLNLITPIDAAIATMRPAAEAKSIQIRPLLDAQVGTISGDASRLQQVFWNLLSNAIKFTPVGGQVEVRLEQVGNRQSAIGNGENQSHSPLPTPHSPTYAQITVTDNGQGIAPEFLPYVFDSFRQADASTTRNYNGLGLGLAIVRHLVELHGGTVSANSLGEGQGATFIVKLPLLLDTEPATREQSETEQEQTHSSLSEEPISEAPASTTTPALTRKSDINNSNQAEAVASMEPIRTFNLMLTKVRVLVVDDAPDSREFVEFVLKENGAIVRSAASVDEAIGILKQFFPHVLVSDLSMPESDGYNLIHQIKQLQAQLLAVTPSPHNSLTCYSSDFSDDLSRRPSAAKELANLKAIALTARAAAEDRQRAISAGFQHYLTKPIEPSELISAISNLLEDHQKMPQ